MLAFVYLDEKIAKGRSNTALKVDKVLLSLTVPNRLDTSSVDRYTSVPSNSAKLELIVI